MVRLVSRHVLEIVILSGDGGRSVGGVGANIRNLVPGHRAKSLLLLAILLLLAPPIRAESVKRAGSGGLRPPQLPAYLPDYRVHIELDLAKKVAMVHQLARWTNPTKTPTDRLVFHVHSRYVVPGDQVGYMAKTLEILRVTPSESLGYTFRPCEIQDVSLVEGEQRSPLKFTFEGDTETTMVVPLPKSVGPGESVTVALNFIFRLPEKQGRWGIWDDVCTLSNWLPVFAYYGDKKFGPRKDAPPPSPAVVMPPAPVTGTDIAASWQPVPFIPWHQPFFNESGNYDATLILPRNQVVASTGCIESEKDLEDGRKQLHIHAEGVRDFTLLCSHRFCRYEGVAPAGPHGSPVRILVHAFPEFEHYARCMVKVAASALELYAQWFGPYPWPNFSVSQAYFGWNGNECSTLVMIDQRVFAMPHVAEGYVEYLLSHEICHQWWYNLVGTNGYCETWMDEGMANYFSHRMLSLRHGKNNDLITYPSGLKWLPNIRRNDYRSAGMYSTLKNGELGPAIQEIPRFGHLANLFNTIYDKGGRTVGMIEDRLGEAPFFDFIRIIYRKYGYRILSVRDFQMELETYTGQSWEEFFRRWLYEAGMTDWRIKKVAVAKAPKCVRDRPRFCFLKRKLLIARGKPGEMEAIQPGCVRLTVWVNQEAENDEPTTLGIALDEEDKYTIRIPLLLAEESYSLEELGATVTVLPRDKKGGARLRVDVNLPCEPIQVAVDPDQILIDSNPANNFWHPPLRWRITPLYTFLEETDLTTAYDRWNILLGPWLYTPTYATPWFTRSTMLGVRGGLYRTQEFLGGVYAGYRTNWRDVVAGVDGQWEHWPFPKSQAGFVAERRLAEFYQGDSEASRAAIWSRLIFNYNSSLYLPPIHYVETFAQYSDNFLPFPVQTVPEGIRYDRMSTLGAHYRLNYLTPYWDPEGGFCFDVWYEGGIAQKPSTVALNKIGGQLSWVKTLPVVVPESGGLLRKVNEWLSETRLAFRAYGAAASPSRGEFFSMGGSELFRGFDLAQRQGSTVWVGSVEWRIPILRRCRWDCLDHLASMRNLQTALFYDVGEAYIGGEPIARIAQGVGVGLRFDVTWFSVVERTMLRVDLAQAIQAGTGYQIWLGVNQ
ncbi:MAG: M1 family aminopeptidase, partial [Gemmataceae bacterium]